MKKVLILSLLTILLTGCYEIDNGEKVGNIVKLSREGFIVKTYEGELIRGNMSDGTGAFGKQFNFTIENKKVIETAEKAMNLGKEVKIKYHQELVTFLRVGFSHDNFFVDDILILN